MAASIKAQQNGITLIEVLIALFIVATSLAALLQLSSTVAGSTIVSRDSVNGLFILENYLSEKRIENDGRPITPGASSSTYTWNGINYTIKETRSGTKNDFILKVDLEVFDAGNKKIASMFTYYVANPPRR